jgi:hypothetical protein
MINKCNATLPSTKTKNYYRPQRRRIITVHKDEELLPSTKTKNYYRPQRRRIITVHKDEELLPSTKTKNYYRQQDEQTPTISSSTKQTHLNALYDQYEHAHATKTNLSKILNCCLRASIKKQER